MLLGHPHTRACVHSLVRQYSRPETGWGALNLLEVLAWTAEDRQRVFRKSAMKRAKLGMMKRNALIAAGNALREGEWPALRADR